MVVIIMGGGTMVYRVTLTGLLTKKKYSLYRNNVET